MMAQVIKSFFHEEKDLFVLPSQYSTMNADVVVMQGARVSAAISLT